MRFVSEDGGQQVSRRQQHPTEWSRLQYFKFRCFALPCTYQHTPRIDNSMSSAMEAAVKDTTTARITARRWDTVLPNVNHSAATMTGTKHSLDV
jgi:hypothetical protein